MVLYPPTGASILAGDFFTVLTRAAPLMQCVTGAATVRGVPFPRLLG